MGISEKPKLERAKLAFDNLESPEVCSTPVPHTLEDSKLSKATLALSNLDDPAS